MTVEELKDEKVITITEENFKTEVLESTVPVVVDFWAEWCGPCLALGPKINELATEFDGQVKVGKVNIDKSDEIAAEYRIRSIPTVLFFKNGQLVDKNIGYDASTKAHISDKINRLL
jgi:thioredoxin 1